MFQVQLRINQMPQLHSINSAVRFILQVKEMDARRKNKKSHTSESREGCVQTCHLQFPVE